MTRFLIICIFAATLLWALSALAGQLKPEEKRTLKIKPAVVQVVVKYKTEWKSDVLNVTLTLPRQERGTGPARGPAGAVDWPRVGQYHTRTAGIGEGRHAFTDVGVSGCSGSEPAGALIWPGEGKYNPSAAVFAEAGGQTSFANHARDRQSTAEAAQ